MRRNLRCVIARIQTTCRDTRTQCRVRRSRTTRLTVRCCAWGCPTRTIVYITIAETTLDIRDLDGEPVAVITHSTLALPRFEANGWRDPHSASIPCARLCLIDHCALLAVGVGQGNPPWLKTQLR